MKNYFIIFLIAMTAGHNVDGQVKQDAGQVFYQQNYRPGDWITFSGNRFVTSIAVSHNKAYIGTEGGVLRYDYVKKQWEYPLTTSNGMLDNVVYRVGYDQRTDYVWIATKSGLQFYNPYSQQFTAATYAQIGIDPNETILSIGFDQSNAWLQTAKTFYTTNGTILNVTRGTPPQNGIRWFGNASQLIDRLPNIFTNSESGYQFYSSELNFVDREFRKFPLSCYAFDPFGNIWIGSYGAGAWFANSVSNLAEPLKYGLAMEDVTAMAFDNAAMWFGGYAQPLIQNSLFNEYSAITEWNQETDQFTYYESGFQRGLKADKVTALLIDSHNVWIGTEEGLIRKSKSMDYWSTFGAYSGLFHPHIYALAKQDNRLFIGSEEGLNFASIVDKDYVIQRVDIPELRNLAVFKILISDNVLWLGTDNGIYAIDQNEKRWYHYDAYGFSAGATTYLRQYVRGIAEDDSAIYFASQKNIVRYGKKSKQWESIPLNPDFIESGINDAACDDRNLWIATNSGILRFVKNKRKWIYYSSQDGLAADIVKSILIDGDYVWFGTEKGVTQFYWNALHLKE
ncbi:hypothetical protein HUU42_06885 [bacterium]|nr:hypothetical protein [bacterium]